MIPLDEPSSRPGMRRLVYVDLPVVTFQRTALIVSDENDLAMQISQRRNAALAAFPNAEPVRVPAPKGKQGKGAVASYPLGEDWDKP